MALSTTQAQLKAATPAYQRYQLNYETRIAHDVVFATAECGLDATQTYAFKPSIPPDFRLCATCGAALDKAAALGDLVDDTASRIFMLTKVRITEADARAELAAKAPAPAATAGLVGAESYRDPTRGDAGGTAQTTAQAVEAPSIDPPSPPATLREPRVIVPFPLGGHSMAFLSPDSSNIERVTWLDGDADEPLSWRHRREVTGRLLVEFKQGARYVYDGVPFTAWFELHGAESVGQAFDALVKKHEYRQIEVDELRVVTADEARAQLVKAGAAINAQLDAAEAAEAPKRGRGRNPTKGESELTAAQLAERDAKAADMAARLESDEIPEV